MEKCSFNLFFHEVVWFVLDAMLVSSTNQITNTIMKKTTLAMIIMGFLMMLISSCTKENGPQVGISTDPYGGIIVQLNWGGSGLKKSMA
jgi:hypothetical protein